MLPEILGLSKELLMLSDKIPRPLLSGLFIYSKKEACSDWGREEDFSDWF